MTRVLVIGYGSEVRGDDALGFIAAKRIGSEVEREDVQVLARHLLTPELAEAVSRAGFVLFIDASLDGEPGTIQESDLSPRQARASSFTHHFDPPDLLALAEAMYGRAPRAVALSAVGLTFEVGEALSATVSAALRRLLERAREIIAQEAGPAGPP